MRIVLWWMFGMENVDEVVGRAAGFAGWLFQSSWVPQHIMSSACVVAAIVLMSRLAIRTGVLHTVTFALVVAAAFESSTWIGGVTFAAVAPLAALVLLGRAEHRGRFVAALVVAAVLAGCIAAPFLRDQLTVAAGRGSPVALQFYPVLEDDVSEQLRAVLDPLAFWLVLLPIELPAVYAIGMVSLALFIRRYELANDERRLVLALAALTGASLGVSWLLASTVGENNDLGWRAVLPACMALTVFAASGLSRWIAARKRIAVSVSAAAIVLAVPGSIDIIGTDVVGRDEPAGKLFATTPELWAAVRRHAAADERVGNNPLFLQEMTPWPDNIDWALLADRRSCYAGRELALVFTSLAAERREAIDAQFARVFAGDGSSDDVRQLARSYDCRVIVVTATDGAWTRDPFAASSFYRLVEEKPDRWRIYRIAQ